MGRGLTEERNVAQLDFATGGMTVWQRTWSFRLKEFLGLVWFGQECC